MVKFAQWQIAAALGVGMILFFSPAVNADKFVKAASMSLARNGHSATLLPDGKVLVAGGAVNSENIFSNAEFFDPSNGLWTATGAMNFNRAGQSASLLPNGKVLVVGGVGIITTGDGSFDSALTSAEIYDSATGTWSITGAMNKARVFPTATLLRDGTVLEVGGCDMSNADPMFANFYNPTNSRLFPRETEIYDPATGKWSLADSLESGRIYHTATLLANGEVLVAGGGGPPPYYTEIFFDAEIFNPTDQGWRVARRMNIPRELHTATLLLNGKVLIAGGLGTNSVLADCELYDPASGKWMMTGSLNTPRLGHTATLLPNGCVLVTGGFKDKALNPISKSEIYNPATGKWIRTASLNIGRAFHTATPLADGRILIAGGGSYMFSIAGRKNWTLDVKALSKTELFIPGK